MITLKDLKTTDRWGLSVYLTDYFSPCPFLPTAELLIVWSSSSSVAELFSAKVAMNFFSSSYKQELSQDVRWTFHWKNCDILVPRWLWPANARAHLSLGEIIKKPEKWILRHIPDLLQVDLTSFLASGASFRTKDVSENLVTCPLLPISHPQERMI